MKLGLGAAATAAGAVVKLIRDASKEGSESGSRGPTPASTPASVPTPPGSGGEAIAEESDVDVETGTEVELEEPDGPQPEAEIEESWDPPPEPIQEEAVAAPETEAPQDPAPASPADPGKRIDVNAADFDQLRTLNLSVSQAKRIIATRDEKGGFSTLDELASIRGLSAATIAELRDRLAI